VTVSSTKIRQLIEKGDVEKANNYLGYEYFVNGEVIMGNGIGNDLGFPTANVLVKNERKLFPIDGVYAVKVKVDGSLFNGMMNIGKKPTVNGKYKSLEVNIFNFSSDIYGKEIKIRFFKRVRDEKKFESLDSLKKQLVRDRNKVQQILG
jgi:riboflavin kinase/FMN adenylyltransferase